MKQTLAISADAAGVRAAVAFAASFAAACSLGEPELVRLQLVVEELVTNLAKYSGARGAELSLWLDQARPALELSDDGRPFDPLAAAPPNLDAPAEDRPVGGLGLHLVRSLAQTAHYARDGDRNRLTLTLRAAPEAA